MWLVSVKGLNFKYLSQENAALEKKYFDIYQSSKY